MTSDVTKAEWKVGLYRDGEQIATGRHAMKDGAIPLRWGNGDFVLTRADIPLRLLVYEMETKG